MNIDVVFGPLVMVQLQYSIQRLLFHIFEPINVNIESRLTSLIGQQILFNFQN
jgi:hypothetical protein